MIFIRIWMILALMAVIQIEHSVACKTGNFVE